jgi:hypothetical protein
VFAELALGGHALGVRFEVARQMRPAELAACERQMGVGPPAIRGHDCPGVGEQALRVVLMAIRGDVQEGVSLIEDAPQRAALPGSPPPRLVHMHRPTGAQPIQQVRAWLGERIGDTAQDRVDRARADPRPEQLLAELDDVATRDAVAHRQRRDRGLEPRPEHAPGDLPRELGAPPAPAARAAHALAAMLRDRDRDHRQLLELVAHRLARRDQLTSGEHMTALAASGPLVDAVVARPRRQQRTPLALMPRLAALPAPRRILALSRRAARRIHARRLRRVARAAIQPALELCDPLTLPSDRLRQLLDLAVHPQQHLDHDLAAGVIDRLRFSPLHTTKFDAPELCPPTN